MEWSAKNRGVGYESRSLPAKPRGLLLPGEMSRLMRAAAAASLKDVLPP